jgi:hypothetical protein
MANILETAKDLGQEVYTKAEVDSTIGGIDLSGYLEDTAHSFSTNGYQKLSNGLIIQWGTFTESTSSTDYKTFPIAFPNICYMATLQLNSSTPGGLGINVGTVIQIIDRTKFIWTGGGSYGGGGIAYVIAIGK